MWAQRPEQLFIGLDVQDVKDEKINLTENKLTFEGTSHGKKYTSELEFSKEIDPAVSFSPSRPPSFVF